MISDFLTSAIAACVLFLGMPAQPAKAGTALVKDLKCEYRSNPLGLDVQQPRLSWRIEAGDRGWLQNAYQIRVAQNPAALVQGTPLIWDSGKTTSRESLGRVHHVRGELRPAGIFGHTPMRQPLLMPNKIGIDTGCVYGNFLTCIKLPQVDFYYAGHRF